MKKTMIAAGALACSAFLTACATGQDERAVINVVDGESLESILPKSMAHQTIWESRYRI